MKTIIIDYDGINNDNIINFLKDKMVNYIKLKYIQLNNNFVIKNYHKCKVILSTKLYGPKPTKNTYQLPELLEFIIEYNVNIYLLIDNINNILYNNKFNDKIDNEYSKGLYFSLNENYIKITNLSHFYIVNLDIINESNDNKINENLFKNYLGFVKNNYIIMQNNNINIKHNYDIPNEYIYVNINNYNNIITNTTNLNINNNKFAKLTLNTNTNTYNANIEYVYYFDNPSIINNIDISFINTYEMNLEYCENYNINIELSFIDNNDKNTILLDKMTSIYNITDNNDVKINNIINLLNNISIDNKYENILNKINDIQNYSIKLSSEIDHLKKCLYNGMNNKTNINIPNNLNNVISDNVESTKKINNTINDKITKVNVVKRKKKNDKIFPMNNINILRNEKNFEFNY